MKNRDFSRHFHPLTPLFFSFIFLTAGSIKAQSLAVGNLIGVHTVDVKLDPDVTMNQYKNFLKNKWMPAAEKAMPGFRAYLVEGARGAAEGSLGFIFIYESDAARNMYWNEDGSPTSLWEEANKKMEDVNMEGRKLASWTSKYTDWIVQ